LLASKAAVGLDGDKPAKLVDFGELLSLEWCKAAGTDGRYRDANLGAAGTPNERQICLKLLLSSARY
jgi:hypothetical protein